MMLATILRIFHGVTAVMSFIGGAGILFIMGLVTADVFGRSVLGHPIAGVPEIVAMLILSIVFLQLAHTLMSQKLTRADGLLMATYARSPRIAGMIDAGAHLLGATLVGVLIYAFGPLLLRAWRRGDTVGTLGQFIAPLWPTYLVVLIGAVALFLAFVLRALEVLSDSRTQDRP